MLCLSCSNVTPILPSVYVAVMQHQFCPDQKVQERKSRGESPGAQKDMRETKMCAPGVQARAPGLQGHAQTQKVQGRKSRGEIRLQRTGQSVILGNQCFIFALGNKPFCSDPHHYVI